MSGDVSFKRHVRRVLIGAAFALLWYAVVCAPVKAESYAILGDWVIGPGEVVVNESDEIDVIGNIVVQGDLTLTNCTVIVSYIRSPPPPAIEQTNNVFVTGNLTLYNTTITFDVPPNIVDGVRPGGFQLNGSANLTISDFDGDAGTPSDASRVNATLGGTHSTFGPGTTVSLSNSIFDNGGWNGSAGFAFDAASFTINNSVFQHRLFAVPQGFLGLVILEARNGTVGSISDSTFNGSAIRGIIEATAINISGSPSINISDCTFNAFWRALAWSDDAGVRATNLTMLAHGIGIELNNMAHSTFEGIDTGGAASYPPGPWAPPGTLVAAMNSHNLTFSAVRALSSLGPVGAEPPTLFVFLDVQDSGVTSVDGDRRVRLGELFDSKNIRVDHISATSVQGGLNVTTSSFVRVDNITLEGPGARFGLFNVADVQMADISVTGVDGLALHINGSSRVVMERFDAQAMVGIFIQGSNDVVFRDLSLETEQTGFSFNSGRNLTMERTDIVATGTGVELFGASSAFIVDTTIEHSIVGLDLYRVDRVFVLNMSLTSWVGLESIWGLRARIASSLSFINVSFAGQCMAVGTIEETDSVLLERFSASGCQRGLRLDNLTVVEIFDMTLDGIWNGTGLTIDSTDDVLLDRVRVTDTGDVGISMSLTTQVRMSNVNVTGSGAAGALFVVCTDVVIQSSQFLDSGAAGLVLFRVYEPIVVSQVRVSGNGNGVHVLATPNATLTDVEASDNVIDGVYLDFLSENVTLRNLTLARNLANGILLDAANVTLIDGNISANGWDGIAAGLGIRVSWTVEVAASFTDGRGRLPGDITVATGATFRVERATLRPDATPIEARSNAWNAWSFQAGATALFDQLKVDPVNASAAYEMTFGPGCVVTIRDSEFIGAARGDPRSRITAVLSTLVISGSNFSGFYSPLLIIGGAASFTDSLFFDNANGLSTLDASISANNLTASEMDANGIEMLGGQLVDGIGIQVLDNNGIGLRLEDMGRANLIDLVAVGNMQGGALVNGTPLTVAGAFLMNNSRFGMAVGGASRVDIANFTATSNTGAGLRVEHADQLTVSSCRIDRAGAYGMELIDVVAATVTACTLERSGAYGLLATNAASLLMTQSTFDNNSVSHLVLRGTSVVTLQRTLFLTSPGDALVARDSVSVRVEDLLTLSFFGGVLASDNAYAYLLNATLPLTARAEGSAQVDVAWRVRAVVRLDGGAYGAAAAVLVEGDGGMALANATADSFGWTPPMEVLERSVYGEVLATVHTPQSFGATMPSGIKGRTIQPVTANAEVLILIDDNIPSAQAVLDGPPGANGWFTGPVTVTLEATDASGGLLTLWWRSTADSLSWMSVDGTAGTATTSFVVATEGTTTVEFYATDAAGNRDATKSVRVAIDSVPPVVDFGSLPSIVTALEVLVSWNGTDENGSANLTYVLDWQRFEGPWTEALNGTSSSSLLFRGEEGWIRFRVVATDEAGHDSPAAAVVTVLAVNGTLTFRVIDALGNAVAGVEVVVAGVGGSINFTSPMNLTLPPGEYNVTLSAPGFSPRTVQAHVTAGHQTDLGPLTLERVSGSAGSPAGLVLTLVLIAAAAALAVAGLLYLRKRRPPKVGAP